MQNRIQKMENWKALGPESVRAFGFKRFYLHGLILESCLDSGEVQEWM